MKLRRSKNTAALCAALSCSLIVSPAMHACAESGYDAWLANDTLPASRPDAHSSTRRNMRGLALRPGDEIRIEGVADAGENVCIDSVEVNPADEKLSGR